MSLTLRMWLGRAVFVDMNNSEQFVSGELAGIGRERGCREKPKRYLPRDFATFKNEGSGIRRLSKSNC